MPKAPNKRRGFASLVLSLILAGTILMSAGSALALGAESGTDGVKPFPLNVPIGGLTQVDPTNNDTLGNYINAWYVFAIGIAGILATIMIMVAGVQWLISRGDAGKISEAKGRMIAAITGLALVFMAYTLLALVNPKLLTIEMPSLTQLKWPGNANEQDNPTNEPITPINEENVVNSSDPNIAALSGTPEFVDAATNLINQLDQNSQLPPGFRVTSGYRPGNGTSQHNAGRAFDVIWDNMDVNSANTFVANVQSIDPSFSTIIEVTPQQQVRYRATGANVHLDRRPIPIHLN